jgi:hypothetical protein
MVKVAFYKGMPGTFFTNLGDKLIRWWTNGPYSHAEIITQTNDKGEVYSHSAVFLNGAGVRSIWRSDIVEPNWDVVELPEIDPSGVEAWFAARQGCKYDLIGLLGFVWRRDQYSKNKYFCSETVMDSLGIAEGWRFDPNALKPIIDKLSTFQKGN